MVYLITVFLLILLGAFILYSIYKIEAPKQESIWEDIKKTLNEKSLENASNEIYKSHQSLNVEIRQNKSANDDCYSSEKNTDLSAIFAKDLLIHSSNVIKTTTTVARLAASYDMTPFVALTASHRARSTSFKEHTSTVRKAVVKSRMQEASMFPNFDELGVISPNIPVNLSDHLTKVNLTHP